MYMYGTFIAILSMYFQGPIEGRRSQEVGKDRSRAVPGEHGLVHAAPRRAQHGSGAARTSPVLHVHQQLRQLLRLHLDRPQVQSVRSVQKQPEQLSLTKKLISRNHHEPVRIKILFGLLCSRVK